MIIINLHAFQVYLKGSPSATSGYCSEAVLQVGSTPSTLPLGQWSVPGQA